MRAFSLLMSPLITISWMVSIFSRNSGTFLRNLFTFDRREDWSFRYQP